MRTIIRSEHAVSKSSGSAGSEIPHSQDYVLLPRTDDAEGQGRMVLLPLRRGPCRLGGSAAERHVEPPGARRETAVAFRSFAG